MLFRNQPAELSNFRNAAKTLGVEFPWPDQYKRCDVGPLGK